MTPQIKKEGTPAILYRNAIDLNRFSNGVQNRLVKANKKVLVRAIEQLAKIDDSEKPSYKAARLRALLKQTKESLGTWRKESVSVMIKELEGIADVQAGFVESQIEKALPSGVLRSELNPAGYSVQTVAVSPDFAKAVVTKDPSVVTLRATGPFDLTAAQGAQLTLPNGDTVEKAFRGIASRELSNFKQTVRTGLLSGEPTEDIVRQLMGNLEFGQRAGTPLQAALSGDAGFKMARHQIRTVVRTSVNQVSNAASKQVYKANEDVTEKYRYVATLDSRTSALCASLDGQEFEYDKGPEPPQHFNCRSTTVAVIDWDGLRKKYPQLKFDDPAEGKRAAAGGMVPADTTYGKWLHGQRAKTKSGKLSQFTPGPRQIEALGKGKAKYFNRLAKKYGPDEAIKKFVRTDGTEISLAQLQKRYPKLTSITASKPTIVIKNQKQLEKFAEAARAKDLPSMSQLQIQAAGAKIKPKDVTKVFDLMDEMEGVAGANARKLRRFAEKKEVCCIWSTQREGTIIKNRSKMDHVLKNAQMKKSMERALKNEKRFRTNTDDVYQRVLDNAINVDEKESGPQSKLAFANHFVKSYFTAQGKGRSRMNGMTFPGANHILIKRKADMRPITSLKQMREDVKDAIKRAKTGKDLYWSANGEGMYKGESHWLKTYVHEMGHQVHYASGKPTLNSYDWTPSQYGSSNADERFAETFVQYIFAPVELKKASPSAYKWVEDTLLSSLKEVETWK
jgi:SPP1 gp7 family putative phage head morphogenesis protein